MSRLPALPRCPEPGPVLTVTAFTIDAGQITALDVMRNPDNPGGVPEPG
jgi:hypothetical protein